MATSTSSSSLDSASAENFSSAVDSVMEETSSSHSSEHETVVRTIINSLKSPAPSQLARKRKIHSNPPTGVIKAIKLLSMMLTLRLMHRTGGKTYGGLTSLEHSF